MTHISKISLDPAILVRLENDLASVISQLNKNSVSSFTHELLGPEERLMLAKRLVAVTMLTQGYSSYRIWQTLKISPSSADRIRLDFERGRYRRLQTLLQKDKISFKKILSTLELLLTAGLPTYNGKDRWRIVRKQLQK